MSTVRNKRRSIRRHARGLFAPLACALMLPAMSACVATAPLAPAETGSRLVTEWQLSRGVPPVTFEAQPVSPPIMREVRLKGDDSQLLVEARLNGQVSGIFLLDTGATYCVITPDTARRLGSLGHGTLDSIALSTPGGQIEAPMLTLETVEVAQATAGDVPTVVYPAVEKPLSGILGLSFLRRFEFSVDARRRLLRLRPF